MDAYEYLSRNLPRDSEAEQRLATDEQAVLTAIKQMAERGEISAQSARTMTLYFEGMSGTVKLYKNVEQ